jgi:hypothetical protein
LVEYDRDISTPCFDEEEAGVSILVSRIARWDNVDVLVHRAGGLVIEVGDGQIYPLTFT